MGEQAAHVPRIIVKVGCRYEVLYRDGWVRLMSVLLLSVRRGEGTYLLSAS